MIRYMLLRGFFPPHAEESSKGYGKNWARFIQWICASAIATSKLLSENHPPAFHYETSIQAVDLKPGLLKVSSGSGSFGKSKMLYSTVTQLI